ncbi:MAG: hypothetical protein H0V79_10890 [Actinobacteria bacterium]|nr:hypothetical protein [Actinomycetota bacterium]
MVDFAFCIEVAGADLREPLLAMDELRLLGVCEGDAFEKIALPFEQVTFDCVELGAALVEEVDGVSQDVPLDAAADALPKAL